MSDLNDLSGQLLNRKAENYSYIREISKLCSSTSPKSKRIGIPQRVGYSLPTLYFSGNFPGGHGNIFDDKERTKVPMNAQTAIERIERTGGHKIVLGEGERYYIYQHDATPFVSLIDKIPSMFTIDLNLDLKFANRSAFLSSDNV